MASGKTVGILQALALLCAESTNPVVTTVTGQSFPHLKGGALRDFELFVYPHFKSAIKAYHKTDHLFTFKSGDLLEFKVFENEMAARGPKRERLFINEANKFEWMTYYQLDARSNQTIIDYNPSSRFWAHEKLHGVKGNELLLSDHTHNYFLSDAKHNEIEGQTDPELYKVYARGLTGNVTGVIFPNWEMIEDSDYPTDEEYTFGIDFGYENDPTAIVKICKVANTLFIKELAYEPGLPVITQAQLLRANGYTEYTSCFCEHDPDQIRALRMHGIRAEMARKGPGSVNAGIKQLKTYNVKYTASSQNLKREQGSYIWLTDNKTGDITSIPIDKWNHAMDATRYAAYTKFLRHG
jgi:phage terminase large subunit